MDIFGSILRRRMFRQGLRMKHPEMFDASGNFIKPQRQTSGQKQGNVFERLTGKVRSEQGATINGGQSMQSFQGRNTLG